MRVALLTLGCDKNTVDSERYLAQLEDHGAERVHDLSDAELIIVNTCGFIDAAKRESLDAIVDRNFLVVRVSGARDWTFNTRGCGWVGIFCMRHRHNIYPNNRCKGQYRDKQPAPDKNKCVRWTMHYGFPLSVTELAGL